MNWKDLDGKGFRNKSLPEGLQYSLRHLSVSLQGADAATNGFKAV